MAWRDRLAAAPGAIRAFILKHWLPLCFLVATLIALTAPAPGKAVASVVVSTRARGRRRGGGGDRPAVPPCCCRCRHCRRPRTLPAPFAPLQVLGNVHLFQTINIIIVFLISGLVLRTEDIKQVGGRWEGGWPWEVQRGGAAPVVASDLVCTRRQLPRYFLRCRMKSER